MKDLFLKSYNYKLPKENIAQFPVEKRENSRLMVLDVNSKKIRHRQFSDIIGNFNKGDLLVVNNTKVFPARLIGKKSTGGKVEIFLLEFPTIKKEVTNSVRLATGLCLIKSSKRPQPGTMVRINNNLNCKVVELLDGGKALIELYFNHKIALEKLLEECGQIPLPPYIERQNGSTENDVNRYQTVYANQIGAVAAPTAGLHFSNDLLRQCKEKGVKICPITLHVGYGTFSPVRSEIITEHNIHSEFVHISQDTADKINSTSSTGGTIWAIGTTTMRTLEFATDDNGKCFPVDDWCDLYIYPGYQYKSKANLITNFHLPQSSLMFLVSAICGRETLLNCYNEAIENDYRFFSYGDAMAIIR